MENQLKCENTVNNKFREKSVKSSLFSEILYTMSKIIATYAFFYAINNFIPVKYHVFIGMCLLSYFIFVISQTIK